MHWRDPKKEPIFDSINKRVINIWCDEFIRCRLIKCFVLSCVFIHRETGCSWKEQCTKPVWTLEGGVLIDLDTARWLFTETCSTERMLQIFSFVLSVIYCNVCVKFPF